MEADLLQSAKNLLGANTQTAQKRGRVFRFTVPSPLVYPFQWFWDSCFHAIVWTHFDIERAKDELRGLFAFQAPDGFIPHVIFWNQKRVRRTPFHWNYLESRGIWNFLPLWPKPKTTYHIQPPVLAQAIEKIYERGGGTEFLREVFTGLAKYYGWLARERDPDGDGLISIIAQFESGLDFSPAYDLPIGVKDAAFPLLGLKARIPEIRNKFLFGCDLKRIFKHSPYHQEDILVNSIYIQGLHSLANIADTLGEGEAAEWARKRAGTVLENMVSKCWDEKAGLFWNLVGRQEKPSKVKTIISLMPLICPGLPGPIADKLLEHLTNPEEFWTPHPVPSVAMTESGFDEYGMVSGRRRIWRGPLSMNTNWFLAGALNRLGREDIAQEIREKSRRLAERHGFNEFFNPLNGMPAGADDFGWATLVVDM